MGRKVMAQHTPCRETARGAGNRGEHGRTESNEKEPSGQGHPKPVRARHLQSLELPPTWFGSTVGSAASSKALEMEEGANEDLLGIGPASLVTPSQPDPPLGSGQRGHSNGELIGRDEKLPFFLYSQCVCFDLTVLIMTSCYKDGPGLGMGSRPDKSS